MVERLKQTACPHCNVVGALIRHGVLLGYDDRSPRRKTLRARRILCSNRNRRRGCGRTFSVWITDKIRRLSVTAGTLWRFLQGAVAGSIAAAIAAVVATGAASSFPSHRTWQRVWKRFDRCQSTIRTALFGRRPPPEPTTGPSRRPAAAHVLAHLRAAFPDADSPIAAYQHATQTFFV